MNTVSKLVVFDVEGVLIPKARFLLFEVFSRVGLKKFAKAATYGLLYWMGLLSLDEASRRIFKLLEGFPYSKLITLLNDLPLMPTVVKVFSELKREGFKTALISSGIPQEGLELLAERLGADYVSGLEVGVSEGLLTGEISGDVLEPEGKALALRRIFGKDSTLSSCVAVADDRNNASLFEVCSLRIAYNPDFLLGFKADHVVKGELEEILPIITGKEEKGGAQITRRLLLRKLIHIGGFLIPFACISLIPPAYMALVIFSMTLLYLTSETLRMLRRELPIISHITRAASERYEYEEYVTAPIFYAFGIIITLLIFPNPRGYSAIMALTLGDGFASLAGKGFRRGRNKLNKGKTLTGSATFFTASFIGSLAFVDPLTAFYASFIGMAVELLPLPINDNLTIPISVGFILHILYSI
ncbi:haloacid dehalogenase-like hydrolase [Candidatus Bathyarchaeota archaeon]|nr:haloacid dehalogenase-like hydrolase [Candidatus Bathyarchaeota archaeon]